MNSDVRSQLGSLISGMSNSDLKEVSLMLRNAWNMNARQAVLEFRPCDKVNFVTKTGRKIYGVVTKYNQKTVGVFSSDGRNWRVGPSFLKTEATTNG